MPKLSSVGIDKARASEGVWVAFEEGWYIKIARYGHPKHAKLLTQLQQPHLGQIARGKRDVLQEIVRQAAAQEIVRDWGAAANGEVEGYSGRVIEDAEDLVDEDGNVIECTPDNVLRIIRDPQYAEVWEFIDSQAGSQRLFRLQQIETDAGN